jgi:D-glycero-alpha-D-manno-heptose-7-phosphate kinase
LIGGFTDFPQFYRNHGGETISCAIDKFLTVSITENNSGGVDIRSASDLPSGIGLGSSGAFHSGLVAVLAQWKERRLEPAAIANIAYALENGIDSDSTGRQDSLACLCRGVSRITYGTDDSITASPILIPASVRAQLSRNLLLFDTGERRRASHSIKDIFSKDREPLLRKIAALPADLAAALDDGDLDFLGEALNTQERLRSELSPTCRSPKTDRLLEIARTCGAGARLAGAGLGCLVSYCPEGNQMRLRREIGIPEIKFSILW